MSIYEGKTYDENGYRPFLVRFLGRERNWDLNVVTFTITTVLLIAAVSLITSGSQIYPLRFPLKAQEKVSVIRDISPTENKVMNSGGKIFLQKYQG
jgi:hypothetical protein